MTTPTRRERRAEASTEKSGLPLHVARQLKHAAFVAQKRALRAAENLRIHVESALWRNEERRHPYIYHPGMYRRSFLNWNAEPSEGAPSVPRRIFAIWSDDGTLPPPREAGLNALRAVQTGIPVELITPQTLPAWVVDAHPLHPAFRHLSLVHQSDYLRAYLLHHHGGGYCDIKAPLQHWGSAFDQADRQQLWVLGYPERSTQWVAQLPRQLGLDLKRYHRNVPGGSALIVRSGTTFTREWMAELERRLDYLEPLLNQHAGGNRNEVPEYPVSWNDLLAKIIHPLALKHHQRVSVREDMLPDIENYR